MNFGSKASFNSPSKGAIYIAKPGNTVFCLQSALIEAALLITWLNGPWLARFLLLHMDTVTRNFSSTMASDSDASNNLETIDVRYGYVMIFSTIFVFYSLNNYVAPCFGTPKSVRNDPWRWRNLFISWIHGMIAGIWNILWYDYTFMIYIWAVWLFYVFMIWILCPWLY